ncbi:hypothetical protein Peur_067636 [Populus x canadensis]
METLQSAICLVHSAATVCLIVCMVWTLRVLNMISCQAFGNAEATRDINYGAIVKGDHEPFCGPTHPCVKTPANGYHRGCEAINKCRGGRNDNI